MKIDLILKANVEWQKNDADTQKKKDYLSLIAALLSIVASLLTILSH